MGNQQNIELEVDKERIANLLANVEVIDEQTIVGRGVQDFIVSYRLKLNNLDFYINGYSRDFVEGFDIEKARNDALKILER